MCLGSSALVAGLVLAAAACGSSAGGGGSDPSLDAEGSEQQRSGAESIGLDAFDAAATAFDVTGPLDGSGRAGAESCSGAPDGYVRAVMGTSLLYQGGSPADATDAVVKAWSDLGLDDVSADEEGQVDGSVDIEGVEVTLVLQPPTRATDGSDREFRTVSLSSGCVDVGSDLARDVTR